MILAFRFFFSALVLHYCFLDSGNAADTGAGFITMIKFFCIVRFHLNADKVSFALLLEVGNMFIIKGKCFEVAGSVTRQVTVFY